MKFLFCVRSSRFPETSGGDINLIWPRRPDPQVLVVRIRERENRGQRGGGGADVPKKRSRGGVAAHDRYLRENRVRVVIIETFSPREIGSISINFYFLNPDKVIERRRRLITILCIRMIFNWFLVFFFLNGIQGYYRWYRHRIPTGGV